MMSFKTWTEEFYPIHATSVCETDAAAHSLQKWKGLRKDSLAKHKMEASPDLQTIEGGKGIFPIDSCSCALCAHHFNDDEYDEEPCETCHLARHLGHRCDELEGPFLEWSCNGNPEPMIEALEAITKWPVSPTSITFIEALAL